MENNINPINESTILIEYIGYMWFQKCILHII